VDEILGALASAGGRAASRRRRSWQTACVSVDVWTADLDALPPAENAAAILSPDEVARAERFRFAHHRHRFTRCRLLLRSLLGQTLAVPPASLQFHYGLHGKPELKGVHFNVSHSGPLAVIAISREQPIGIDIEQIDRRKDVVSLARTAFSVAECAELDAMSPEEQIAAFYRGWARKEAFLKLLGTGFSRASDSFTISLARETRSQVEGALLCDLHVRDGFACTVAMRRELPITNHELHRECSVEHGR